MNSPDQAQPNRWILGARLRTLPAAIVPVLVGSACAVGEVVNGLERGDASVVTFDWLNFALAMVVSLALQVATNYSNDYADGKRGTDDPSKRVGPPRLVGNGLATAHEVRNAMIATFGVALLAGGVLVLRVGWELVPVGIAAVAAGYFYTGGPRPYGYMGLGELFVFVFFGLVATVGSTYVQLERITLLSVGCGVAVGALATALLVINNLRDIPGDTTSGKRTLAVALGDERTRYLYVGLLALPFVLLPVIAGLGSRPLGALAFVVVILATKPVTVVLSGAQGLDLIPVLAGTGKVQLAFGVVLSAGIVLSTL